MAQYVRNKWQNAAIVCWVLGSLLILLPAAAIFLMPTHSGTTITFIIIGVVVLATGGTLNNRGTDRGKTLQSEQKESSQMKVLAVIVNIFFPGIGTLIVQKWAQAIAQIILGMIAIFFIFTGIGIIIGVPLAFIVWIWAIISAATSKPQPIQIVIQQKVE